MVLLKPFFNSTLLFSSISPEYRDILLEEIYGCVKYIKLDFNAVKKMPVKERKLWIMRHNTDAKNQDTK